MSVRGRRASWDLTAVMCAVLSLLACSPSAAGAAEDEQRRAGPVPPLKTSEIGYVTVAADELPVPPPCERMFITPNSKLSIYEQDAENFFLLAERKDNSFVCKLPKTAHAMTLIRLDADANKLHFRGAVETVTVPLAIKKGVELPILAMKENAYVLLVAKDKLSFPVTIDKSAPGILFSKESVFDKYAKAQKSKGLAYYEGKWIPDGKALALRSEKELAVAQLAARKSNLRDAAEQGYVLLKDGTVLEGKKQGEDAARILFISEGTDYWVGIDDVLDAPLSHILAKGAIVSAERRIAGARALTSDESKGEALKAARRAMAVIEKIPQDASKEDVGAMAKTAAEVRKFIDGTQDYLSLKGLAVYEDKVFVKSDLDRHIAAGHLLLRRLFWVEKAQVCQKCDGAGDISCPKCGATGRVKDICQKCRLGYVPCVICAGAGERTCERCNGTGFIMRSCGYCQGSGKVTSPFPYTYGGGGPQIAIAGNSTMIVSGGGWWPSFTYRGDDPCPVCGGVGQINSLCPSCNGKAKVACLKIQKCVACGGKGFAWATCFKCGGTRRATCLDCAGKGFSGEPQS